MHEDHGLGPGRTGHKASEFGRLERRVGRERGGQSTDRRVGKKLKGTGPRMSFVSKVKEKVLFDFAKTVIV